IDGLLDAESGEVVRTALETLMGPPAAGDERTAPQRRADALVELMRRQLDAGRLPEVGGKKPHLTLVAEMGTLGGEPGAPPAELNWRQLLPREHARRLACDCQLTPVVGGPDGAPATVGRTTRVVPPALRRALVLRDRGCRWPGCDRPPGWTDAHHLRHWADGGATELRNLCLLCRVHHRLAHTRGLQLEWAGVELVVRPP
ncbi:MAG: HNH endonuclease, partial [Candidatus Dormibacteraeota bacterium]|nr:HNH endonuclease [Candidatus Dormibacteraeota bacterium]